MTSHYKIYPKCCWFSAVGCWLLISHHIIPYHITSYFFFVCVCVLYTYKNSKLPTFTKSPQSHVFSLPNHFAAKKNSPPSRGATPPGHSAARPSSARSAPVVHPAPCVGDFYPLPSPRREATVHWAQGCGKTTVETHRKKNTEKPIEVGVFGWWPKPRNFRRSFITILGE